MNEIERCRREIAAIEAEMLAGNPDLHGLLLALSDWSAELRILQSGVRRKPHAEGSTAGFNDWRTRCCRRLTTPPKTWIICVVDSERRVLSEKVITWAPIVLSKATLAPRAGKAALVIRTKNAAGDEPGGARGTESASFRPRQSSCARRPRP